MPVSPAALKAAGCTSENWRSLFSAPDSNTKDGKGNVKKAKLASIKRLERLIANRVQDGRLMNLREYRIFGAIDLAYDAAFAQTTPTIIQDLLGRKWEKTEDLMAQLQQWGINLDELFLKETMADGKIGWKLNPPTFYRVLVPLVKSYVTVRWAKLFNERYQNPLFKYEPMQSNAENRILCEILTFIVQVVTSDYGYGNDLKQAIFQTLVYGFCLMFPREAWHSEYQTNADGEEVLEKEGIRYIRPHPTQVSWDLTHPVWTLNTGTGCEWAAHWNIVRYGDILDNKYFWNRRMVGYATKDWLGVDMAGNFFQEVYPCQLSFPTPREARATSREQNAVYYNTNERDKAVFLTNMFMRLVPSKWGLGKYKNPVWCRFVVASDDTVVYGEPLSYNPGLYFGYDADDLRSRNASLALEIVPFQDQVGNLLSQILLTAKQNLSNINFVDQNILSRTDVDRIKNRGQMSLTDLNLVLFDSTKNTYGRVDVSKAVIPISFQPKDVSPLFTALNTTLAMLERLIQISAQEASAAGPHQQSVEELKQIGGSSSTRVAFTGSFIDDGIDAWKRQQHDACLAYMDDEVESYVPSDIADVEQHLEQLGFAIVSKGEGKIKVKGKKLAIKIDNLMMTGKGPERKNDSQVAQVMMQALMAVANSQVLGQAVGPKAILSGLTMAAKLAGADKDFKLTPDQKQQLDQLSQMAEAIQRAAVNMVKEQDIAPVAKEIAQLQHDIEMLKAGMAKLIGQIAPAPAATPQPQIPPNAPPTGPAPGPAPGSPPLMAQ